MKIGCVKSVLFLFGRNVIFSVVLQNKLKNRIMTKKLLLTFFLIFVSAICYADYKTENYDFEKILFKFFYDEENVTVNNKPKAPIKSPIVYLQGHELLFESNMTGYSIELLSFEDGNTVLYDDVISTDGLTYQLPESFSGDFIIKLTYENFCFVGSIVL